MNKAIARTALRGLVWLIYAALAAGIVWGIAYLVRINGPVYFVQSVIDGLRLGFVYALIALGYTMVYGIVRLINFAHGDVFMVGAFTSFYAISRYGWGFVPAILLAMIVCTLLNVIIERIAYKPLRNAPRIAALITAIGVSFFLEYFTALRWVFSADYITYKRPFEVVVWNLKGVLITNITVIIVGVTIGLLVLLQFIINRTKIGKAMRATSDDKPASRLMGINVDGIISLTFAIGAALAGAGGVLYAIAFPQIWTFMGIMPGLKAFVAAVLGGIGNILGALVGSLLMGTVDVMVVSFVPNGSRLRDLFAFLILIIVFLVKPTGIFGETQIEKV
ncbi:MAG: branched-chain amino acid ABC transporter permease [Chloroflexi bacterium]|mgnify:FL=1|jgi:branched-chain amino acid transport system permease protein|nr:branched-chain amino acid ABC transporter permease [Chloroflexota bacterium]